MNAIDLRPGMLVKTDGNWIGRIDHIAWGHPNDRGEYLNAWATVREIGTDRQDQMQALQLTELTDEQHPGAADVPVMREIHAARSWAGVGVFHPTDPDPCSICHHSANSVALDLTPRCPCACHPS